MANIAINGLGRVGRAALKIIEGTDGAEVVAVNDLVPADNLAYLLRYDTVYGHWRKTVAAAGDSLAVGGRAVPVLAKRDPGQGHELVRQRVGVGLPDDPGGLRGARPPRPGPQRDPAVTGGRRR